MGQTAHPGLHGARRRRARHASVATAALVAAVTLTGCGESIASATTTLTGLLPGRTVTVIHPNGEEIAGIDGLRLHRGDVVRTGPGARATLTTRNRRVYEGSDAAVQILDGARQSLRQGSAVVDAAHGPGLRMSVAALTVETPAGSATRVERAVTLRIGSLTGSTEVASDTGRQLRLAALNQIVVAGDALPDAPTPLRLTDDYGETHAAPALVRDDKALVGLADGIDATGAGTVETVTAAWHWGPLQKTPAGVARSEQLLPVVIAAAGHPKDASERYHSALELRMAGGSWGVVAHRLDTGSDAVLAALDRLEHFIASGRVGTIPAAIAVLIGDNSGGSGGSGHGHGGGSHGGGTTPSARPSPSPSDSGVVGTVSDTIDQVLKLLPTPTPTPTAIVPVPASSVPALPLGHASVIPSPSPAPH